MPDFWQDAPGTALKPAPAARPVTAAPSRQDECREVEPAPVAAAPDDMEVVKAAHEALLLLKVAIDEAIEIKERQRNGVLEERDHAYLDAAVALSTEGGAA